MKTELEEYVQILKDYRADYDRLTVELDDFQLKLTATEENGVWYDTKQKT